MSVQVTMEDVTTAVLTPMAASHAPVTMDMSWDLTRLVVTVCSTYNLISDVSICQHTVYIDVNECVEGTDFCEHNCINNIGSYSCSCYTGYQESDDGYHCSGMKYTLLFLFYVCTLTVINTMFSHRH